MSAPENPTIKHVRAKALEITGERYCRCCNVMRKLDGGQVYIAGNHQRYWRCAICAAFRKEHAK